MSLMKFTLACWLAGLLNQKNVAVYSHPKGGGAIISAHYANAPFQCPQFSGEEIMVRHGSSINACTHDHTHSQVAAGGSSGRQVWQWSRWQQVWP